MGKWAERVWKPKRRPTSRQNDNIKTDLTENKGVEWVYVGQGNNERLVLVNMVAIFCVPEGQGFSWLAEGMSASQVRCSVDLVRR